MSRFWKASSGMSDQGKGHHLRIWSRVIVGTLISLGVRQRLALITITSFLPILVAWAAVMTPMRPRSVYVAVERSANRNGLRIPNPRRPVTWDVFLVSALSSGTISCGSSRNLGSSSVVTSIDEASGSSVSLTQDVAVGSLKIFVLAVIFSESGSCIQA